MICSKCGSNQPDGTVFCSNCGNDMGQGSNQQTQQPYGNQPYGNQPYGNQAYGNQQYGGQAYGNQQYGGQQFGGQQFGGPRGPIARATERSIALCIVLSIVTCGIYGLYWVYCMAEDLNRVSGDYRTSGGMVVLLSIVTCGIYGLYWMYKAGQQINVAKNTRGLMSDNNAGILYLILGIVGLSIVSYALIQNELNSLSR